MQGRPVLILLVEDDPSHAEIVQRNLEGARVANRIIHVTDGQYALDYLQRQEAFAHPDSSPRPDLILLDLRLPRIDGLALLNHLKADQDLKAIPVVVLTTSEMETDLVSAYLGGAASYLVKPVSFEKFVTLLETFGFYWLAWNRYPR